MSNRLSTCVFCQICDKTAAAKIHYEDDEIVIFDDIKPAAAMHFLCIPKHHLGTVKVLTKEDKPLLEKMIQEGKRALIAKGADENDVLMGFHWPPFNSVNHLHLHVIAPASEMSFLSRAIFKPGSFWFVTSDYALNYIQNKLWYGIKRGWKKFKKEQELGRRIRMFDE